MSLLPTIGFVVAAIAALAVLPPLDKAAILGPMERTNLQTELSQPLDEEAYTRDILKFSCSGALCEAWFYTPKRPLTNPPPVVVMAHGKRIIFRYSPA